MAIDFPSSPSVGQTFNNGNVTWVWDGTTWDIITAGPVVYKHAVNHAVGGVDAVTVAQSQVTNLVSDLSTITGNVGLKAPTASPTFTGTPAAPTAAVTTNTTQIATTEFVNAEIANDAIVKTIVDAKGDLVVGTASDTIDRLAVGTNGYVLTADSAQSTGVKWALAAAGATGGGTDQIFYENGLTVNTNYTISTNKNAGTFGPVTVANGVTVTVPDGSTWVVV